VLRGRSVADSFGDPVVVEAVREVARCLIELPAGSHAPQPEDLLRQRADEALDAPDALALDGVALIGPSLMRVGAWYLPLACPAVPQRRRA
jgi:hypothetical protein